MRPFPRLAELRTLVERQQRQARPIRRVAGLLDDAVTALPWVILRVLDRQTHQRALRDPEYARIEALRNEANGHVIAFSSEKGLDFNAWAYQDAVRERMTAHPKLERLIRLGLRRNFTDLLTAAQSVQQRARRGWDDTSVWNLSHALPKTLGTQLLALAEEAHGWPESEDFPTFEDWTAALRANGTALLAYGTVDKELDAMPIHDLDAINAREAQRLAEAQAALHWVADHLPSLWD